MIRSAHFSQCRTYRYLLTREWGSGLAVAFIGLNPSTADETQDDPTIRRCIGYAKEWGYARLHMLNLFAFRATDPADMMAADDPIGPDNDDTLRRVAADSIMTVAAWGVGGRHLGRAATVLAMGLSRLHYLRLTKGGHPGHPLYLPKALRPIEWSPQS